MPECPRCHQPVKTQAVTCPICQFDLKAFGHPGIPLHRASGEAYLCDTCLYHQDETCNFPQRPWAKECILYQDIKNPPVPLPQRSPQGSNLILYWWQQYRLGLIVGLIIVAGVLLALL